MKAKAPQVHCAPLTRELLASKAKDNMVLVPVVDLIAKTLQVPCPPLTKELLASKAKDNVVLVTVVDQIVMKKFGYSFVENVKRANISYWFVAALDPWTSLHLGSMGEEVRSHCFNAPMDKLNYKGQGG
eukprot:gene1025-12704_t